MMKRFWKALLLCCLCLLCMAALTQKAAQQARAEMSGLVAALPVKGGFARVEPRQINGERWLFLPAFADVETMQLTLDGKAVSWQGGEAENGVRKGKVMRGEEALFDLSVMQSQNLSAFFLFSDDPVNEGRNYLEASEWHTVWTTASMAMVDTEGSVTHAGDISKLRGRGNGTWWTPKRPYQFKLEEQADLLDIDQPARTWLLLAENMDGTLLRNRISLDLALEMGMEETSHSEFVDLYYDGEYRGTYLLCEKVQIGPSRVDEQDYDELLETWNDMVGQRNLDLLEQKEDVNRFGQRFGYIDGVVESPSPDAGAYLVELRNNMRWEKARCYFFLGDDSCFEIKNPENASRTMMEYVSSLMQEGLVALQHGGVNPDTGCTVEERFDVDSIARAALINELAYNLDAYTYSSTFFVLPAGERRFRAGPIWDLDLSWSYLIDRSNEGAEGLKGYNSPTRKDMLRSFYGTDVFVQAMRRICTEELAPIVKNILLGQEKGVRLKSLDEYAAHIAASVQMNRKIWDTHEEIRLRYADSFEEGIEQLRLFASQRIQWLENMLMDIRHDLEKIHLTARTVYMHMEKKFTLNIEPFSRASIRSYQLTQETEADEEAYALWRLDAVIDPSAGHVFEDPAVDVNGTPVSCEILEDGGLRISVLLEDASYRPVDYYGEDIGMVYDYETYIANYPEVAEECEYDPELVADYFYLEGMYEGHKGNAFFDPVEMYNEHSSLQQALGEEWWYYYQEFCAYGWEKKWMDRIKLSYLPVVHDDL